MENGVCPWVANILPFAPSDIRKHHTVLKFFLEVNGPLVNPKPLNHLELIRHQMTPLITESWNIVKLAKRSQAAMVFDFRGDKPPFVLVCATIALCHGQYNTTIVS